MALMLAFLSPVLKAESRGMGSSLKVEMVAWGRHKDGFASSLKMFNDAERLRFILTVF